MSEADDGPEIRLRPRRPRAERTERKALDGFVRLMQVFRSTAKGVTRNRRSVGAPPRLASQRCAVRVSYSPNKTKGQWRAHGRYLERESAVGKNAAFGKAEGDVALANRLGEWQTSKDLRVFKLILSPEFGERIDLQQFTRDFMNNIEERLGLPLEWSAVVHNNTEHPHVHVALRGVADGHELRLDKNLIRAGMREEAERLCTRAFGYRTADDILEAQRREVAFARPTSLDQYLNRRCFRDAQGNLDARFNDTKTEFGQMLLSRLGVLSKMGLAQATEVGWSVRGHFLHVLKAMQQTGDRQKMLHQYGILMSDPRLPTQVTRARDIDSLGGRVLAHVQDDLTGSPQMILEGTDSRVHFIRHTPVMEDLRANGHLKTNAFVSFTRNGDSLKIKDHGDAHAYLSSDHVRQTAKRLIQRGIVPTQTNYDGWLGAYQRALANPPEKLGPNRAALPSREKGGRGR